MVMTASGSNRPLSIHRARRPTLSACHCRECLQPHAQMPAAACTEYLDTAQRLPTSELRYYVAGRQGWTPFHDTRMSSSDQTAHAVWVQLLALDPSKRSWPERCRVWGSKRRA